MRKRFVLLRFEMMYILLEKIWLTLLSIRLSRFTTISYVRCAVEHDVVSGYDIGWRRATKEWANLQRNKALYGVGSQDYFFLSLQQPTWLRALNDAELM